MVRRTQDDYEDLNSDNTSDDIEPDDPENLYFDKNISDMVDDVTRGIQTEDDPLEDMDEETAVDEEDPL